MGFEPGAIGHVAKQLSPREEVEVQDVLLRAFPNQLAIDNLVRLLGFLPADFATNVFADTVAKLVSDAVAGGWDGNLILAARERNPGNVRVQQLAARHFPGPISIGIGQEQPAKVKLGEPTGLQTLERAVTQLPALPMITLLKFLTETSHRLCKVEAGRTVGTGFLVGPKAVLTNYHVVAGAVGGAGAGGVACRFDFFGTAPALQGTRKRLAATGAFPVAWAKWSNVDVTPGATALPEAGELDYALLELADEVGEELGPSGAKRGFVAIKEALTPQLDPVPFDPKQPLVIVQHPKGEPMAFAIDTEAILALNGNGTRLRYRTNTEGGSSGSPCFSMGLEPIALHHAGDPDDKVIRAQFNEGIPLHKIVEHIAASFPAAAGLLG